MAAEKSSSHIIRSFAIQRRVIGALLMREIITRYGRHNIGFLWLFVEPALFTLIVTMIWHFTRASRIISIPITELAVTGYASLQLWRNVVSRGKSAISSNNAVLYHRNIMIIDIFISRILIEIAGAVTSFISCLITSAGWVLLKIY